MSNSNPALPGKKACLILISIALCLSQLSSTCYAKTSRGQSIEQKRLERFEKQIDQLRQLLEIPGMSAVIVEDQKVLWARGFGYADLDKRVPASADTLYHIASLTKTFAATLLMRSL